MTTFADIPDFKKDSERRKVNYLAFPEGTPTNVRILDAGAKRYFKHFLPKQRVSVVCPGDGCPICANNRKLIEMNPDVQANAIKGYIGRQTRFMVNVLNRTLVKFDSAGNPHFKGPNGEFPSLVPGTTESLEAISPVTLNRVEVLERGSTLFSQLNALNDSILDPKTGERAGLTNFDVTFIVNGSGKSMTIAVIPNLQGMDVINLADYELYDFDSIVLNLTSDEIQKLLEGISLKDIFALRRSKNAVSMDATPPTVDDDIANEVGDALASLFNS